MEFPYSTEQLNAIRLETKAKAKTEPHLESASFVLDTGMLVLGWHGGAVVTVSARSLEALAKATDEELACVEIIDEGRGVEWPRLDVQMTTMALLQVIFGIRSIQSIARKAGSTRTEAKAAAARANGAKGGRPRAKAA